MSILVTGAAGFIGARVCQALLEQGECVIGIDNLNNYYNTELKKERLSILLSNKLFSFNEIDLTSVDLSSFFDKKQLNDINFVIHFAAQAGVRHSMSVPMDFVDTNIKGHIAILEFSRKLANIKHFIYASSSSVYGRNTALPFRESDRVDHPGSVYAASKRAAELISDCYQHLYGLPQTGLRFFTVYGPWGRPDMAYFKFAQAIMRGETLTLYNGKHLSRDFTYIDDVVDAVLKVVSFSPPVDCARILNVGNNSPESVLYLVNLLEKFLKKPAFISVVSRPAADVETTWASVDAIKEIVGWEPKTSFDDGIEKFSTWFIRSDYL
ncbi:NAD-dependent epimerase/dehydratase family protein [Acetobacter oeni]|uniref:NAD-dependent epimerase n=1 Tax=Acetobacter oeni TaxID=304077 RepID=A0A511XMR5_9PROT|nr:NAD-dependent epimerase/dehydratase family protein [Acetobacter oeni]MBB3884117.1 UDP-glucuronate 4-epimerase [Acetobacter oeni]NHO20120.1 NAD-dependent epimerase/dehydratase family protein [Acetobacter oeni]GBR04296.1 UDP-N-acetylglucosamine 4-epimerase [Acetobacter oeni LMG 21952]GEN64237.1 NAD-dependent epimerase [Acetobacter oeni]